MSKGVLKVLAVLENVMDSNVVILSIEECAKEIQELARAGRERTYDLLRDLVPTINNTVSKQDVERVLEFVKGQIDDEIPRQFEPIKEPHQTLADRAGTCKDKVCLAHSLLGQMEGSLEKIGIAFFDTAGTGMANHVAMELNFRDGSSKLFELTQCSHTRKKHVQTIAFRPFGRPELVGGQTLSFDWSDSASRYARSRQDPFPKSPSMSQLHLHPKRFIQFNLFEDECD